MIDKLHGRYVLICDVCLEESVPFDLFEDAVDAKKELDWLSRQDEEGQWMDICPDCNGN